MKEKDIATIKKEEYVKTVKRDYPPFYASAIIDGSSNENNRGILKTPYSRRNSIGLDFVWYYYLFDEELGKKLIVKEWNTKKEFKRVRKIFLSREKKLLSSVKKDIKIFIKEFCNYMPALNLIYLADVFYDLVKNILVKKIGVNKADNLLDLIRMPLADNFYKKEEVDLLRAKNLKKHVKKYEWLYSRYGSDNTYKLEDVKKKIKSINIIKFRKEYKENKKKIKIAIAEAKKILGEKESYLIDIIQFVVFYRTHRTDIMNKAAFLYIPRLKVEAEKIGLTYPELIFCTKDEILSGNIPSKKEINERKNGHVVVEIDKVAKCYTGVIYSSFKKIFLERDNNTKKFGGFIASKGFVKGNVKLVLCREDFKKIKQGDILVASMTTPEMLSLMKKAVGFITDEGGITSHAAIISREMKKPCIIGTKIATKVLHDGDLVEVDANKGVVKILKRGKGKN